MNQERASRIGKILHEPKSHRRRKGLVALLSDGTLSRTAKAELFRGADACPYCGVRMSAKQKTLDHMVPISKGGTHGLSNVLICCHGCNSRKGDMDFPKWLLLLESQFRVRMDRLYRRRSGASPEQGGLVLMYGTERLSA